MSRKFLLSGLAATLIYVAVVIIGGAIRPGYNHITQFISELIAAGAPNKTLLDPLFAIYNILTAVFAWALIMAVRSSAAGPKKTIGLIGAWTLLAEGLFGFLTLFFPQDAIGTPVTTIGTIHIVLAGLSSLTTMGVMLLMGIWFKADARLKAFGVYSFVSVALVFVFGGLSAALGASQSPASGLMERLTIGGFLQWMAVVSYGLFMKMRERS